MSEETKLCIRCNRVLPIEHFHKNKTQPDGHRVYCKDCVSEYGKKYRSTPQGIYQNILGRQTYYKKHGHWRYKPVHISQDDFVEWWEAQEQKCHYCGIYEDELSLVDDTQNTKATRLTVDCIKNEAGYSLDNMVLACGRCNFVKNDFFTHEDMIKIGKTFITPKWKLMLKQSKMEEE